MTLNYTLFYVTLITFVLLIDNVLTFKFCFINFLCRHASATFHNILDTIGGSSMKLFKELLNRGLLYLNYFCNEPNFESDTEYLTEINKNVSR